MEMTVWGAVAMSFTKLINLRELCSTVTTLPRCVLILNNPSPEMVARRIKFFFCHIPSNGTHSELICELSLY